MSPLRNMTQAEKHLTEFPIKFLKRTVGLVVLLYTNTPDEGKHTQTHTRSVFVSCVLNMLIPMLPATATAAL